MWDLGFLASSHTRTPAEEVQGSDHWTSREVSPKASRNCEGRLAGERRGKETQPEMEGDIQEGAATWSHHEEVRDQRCEILPGGGNERVTFG